MAVGFYELTPDGIRRESEVDSDRSILKATGRRLDFLIIGVLAVAVVLLLTDRLLRHEEPTTSATTFIADKSVAVQRKDADNVFKWLEHARAVKDPGLQSLLYDPFLLPYRHDPRFAKLCKI